MWLAIAVMTVASAQAWDTPSIKHWRRRPVWMGRYNPKLLNGRFVMFLEF